MANNQDHIERELKFASVELDRLRQRLIEMEAERVQPSTFEDNWIFDRDGELEQQGRLLRLRNDNRGARITFKGKTEFEGHTKVRVEHETLISEPESMRRLLEELGYQAVRRYQKMREEWQLGGVTVALDHTPIGDFAEFEGSSAEPLAKRCGFDPEQAERRSYLRLYGDYRKDHPEAPVDMVFEEKSDETS